LATNSLQSCLRLASRQTDAPRHDGMSVKWHLNALANTFHSTHSILQ